MTGRANSLLQTPWDAWKWVGYSLKYPLSYPHLSTSKTRVWKVLICPKKMPRIRMIGDWDSSRQPANRGDRFLSMCHSIMHGPTCQHTSQHYRLTVTNINMSQGNNNYHWRVLSCSALLAAKSTFSLNSKTWHCYQTWLTCYRYGNTLLLEKPKHNNLNYIRTFIFGAKC